MSERPANLFRLSVDMVHPSHLKALFPTLSPPVIARLCGCARLSERLAGQIGGPLMLPPGPDATASERLALRSPARIDEAGRLMGAAWHGRALQSCIDADAVAELDARLGRAVRRFGLRHAALAVVQAPPSAGALGGAVIAAGHACLAAWRDSLSEPYQQLARFKLPCHGLPAAAPDEQAQPIIAQVLQEIADAP